MISISHLDKNIATFEQDDQKYLLNYHDRTLINSISLSLPNTKKIYTWERKFPSYFETFIPEGYLYEIFKNILTKEYGYIDEILNNDTIDTFTNLLNTFLNKNSISGVQPKTIAIIKDKDCEDALKESIIDLKEYIKKTPKFSSVGNKMLDCWEMSLKDETMKEISDDVIKSWEKY